MNAKLAPRTAEIVLTEWESAKLSMERASEREKELRNEYVKLVVPAETYGTTTVDLPNGYKCKVVTKLNYNLDKDKVNDALDQIEKTGEVGQHIANRLVKFTPGLSLTEYKLLSPQHKAIIDTVLTTSNATPTIEIVAPKTKKA